MNFVCDTCGKQFSQKKNLISHQNKIKKCTPNDKIYECKCPKCNKSFTTKRWLQIHMEKDINCKNNIGGTLSNNLTTETQSAVANIESKDILQNTLSEMLKTLIQLNIPKTNNINSNNTQNIQTIENNLNNTQNTQAIDNSNNTQTIENNTMNNMSNACLINYVVNHYPDAKNIEDCIKFKNIPKSVLIDCEDMYFTEGSMKIFKSLCDLGEAHRPIHCTDPNRGNFIYKTNDVWKIDIGGEAIKSHFFPVIQEAYTEVHKKRIKTNPGNSTVIGHYLTEMTSINIKKICQKTLKRLSNDFLAKNSNNSNIIRAQKMAKKIDF